MTTPYASEAFIHRLLGKALAAGASDVHLKVGKPPGARVRPSGDLVYFRGDKIVAEDTDAAARILLGATGEARLGAAKDLCFAYEAAGLGRFRVSLYRQRGALSMVMRSIPLKVPTFAELGVPAAATAMVEQRSGLVLVSGGSGEGKTSTAAAMIGHLNDSYPKHVITLEDPIELVFEDHRASVSQREVGVDTPSFPAGLRAALRQDPDVVLLSELGEPEVFEAALEVAELGRLVVAVLAAQDVVSALARLLALGRGVPDVEARVGAALRGVLAQRLVPKRDGNGVALACEVLVVNAAVREALALPAAEIATALRELMENGAGPFGMQTFEMHLKALAGQGLTSIRPPAA